jgi:hypothetical protein
MYESIKIHYFDSTGKKVSYWGSFSKRQLMHKRFSELGISIENITSLEIRKQGEETYQEYNPNVLNDKAKGGKE